MSQSVLATHTMFMLLAIILQVFKLIKKGKSYSNCISTGYTTSTLQHS